MKPFPGSTSKSGLVPSGRRIAIITGGSRGIGAGLVAGFRNAGYAVVAISRSIESADEDDLLTIRGDITEEQTARNIVDLALDRFGRIDCLVNDGGVHREALYGLHARRLRLDHLGEFGWVL